MALMKHREGNEIKWVGSRPGHRGTQITKSATKSGVGSATLYTVPNGYTLFISYAQLATMTDADGLTALYIGVKPIGEAATVRLIQHLQSVKGQVSTGCTFNPPIEVAQNEGVTIAVDNAISTAYATIHGWIQK